MNKYIVKNCPAYRAGMNLPHYCKAVGCCINTYVDGMDCTTVTSCLIKRVIQVCNEYSDKWEDCDFSNGLADEIFQLLDIEEINK